MRAIVAVFTTVMLFSPLAASASDESNILQPIPQELVGEVDTQQFAVCGLARDGIPTEAVWVIDSATNEIIGEVPIAGIEPQDVAQCPLYDLSVSEVKDCGIGAEGMHSHNLLIDVNLDCRELISEYAADNAYQVQPIAMSSPPPARQYDPLNRVQYLDEAALRSVIGLYFQPGDVEQALRIVMCESKGNIYAANPRSTARGLFQHLGSFWPERSALAGVAGADIFDIHANTQVAAWLVYHDGGWKHWTASKGCW